jgi:hypothetical protein
MKVIRCIEEPRRKRRGVRGLTSMSAGGAKECRDSFAPLGHLKRRHSVLLGIVEKHVEITWGVSE